jgi:hypothetical protein
LGDAAVLRVDLVNWSHRVSAILPPTDPNIFDYRYLHLDSFLTAIGRGAASGDAGHVIRAAIALVDEDVECESRVAHLVHERDVPAARSYIRSRGIRVWESKLQHAIAKGQLRPIDAFSLQPVRIPPPGSMTAALKATTTLVLESLVEAGFDPKRLPSYPAGKPNPAKAAAKAITERKGLSVGAFERAWDQLRQQGLTVDDTLPPS